MIKSKHQNHTHKIRLPFIGTAVVGSGAEAHIVLLNEFVLKSKMIHLL
jgi:hypothetical protein